MSNKNNNVKTWSGSRQNVLHKYNNSVVLKLSLQNVRIFFKKVAVVVDYRTITLKCLNINIFWKFCFERVVR